MQSIWLSKCGTACAPAAVGGMWHPRQFMALLCHAGLGDAVECVGSEKWQAPHEGSERTGKWHWVQCVFVRRAQLPRCERGAVCS